LGTAAEAYLSCRRVASFYYDVGQAGSRGEQGGGSPPGLTGPAVIFGLMLATATFWLTLATARASNRILVSFFTVRKLLFVLAAPCYCRPGWIVWK
jgi:hypothetical protein